VENINMSRPFALILIGFLSYSSIFANETGQNGQLPTVTSESLANVKLALPKDLPGNPTVVLIGFEFDHQAKMDLWVEKLAAAKPEWIQVHLIGSLYGLISGFINKQKAAYFQDLAMRQRVVPIYTNVSNFLSSLGLKDERQQIYIAVVDQTGKVLIAVQGDYDAAKAQAVLSQLKNPVKPD
jgi:hypothetical protein